MWNARTSTPEVTEPPLDLPSTDQWTSRSTTSLDKLLSRRIRFAIHELLIKTALVMSANVVNCSWVKAVSYRSKFLTGQQLLFMSCSSGSSYRWGGGGARNMKSTWPPKSATVMGRWQVLSYVSFVCVANACTKLLFCFWRQIRVRTMADVGMVLCVSLNLEVSKACAHAQNTSILPSTKSKRRIVLFSHLSHLSVLSVFVSCNRRTERQPVMTSLWKW